MKSTYTSQIISQLTQAGYTLSKCPREKQWRVIDGDEELFYSVALGDVVRKAAKAFNLN